MRAMAPALAALLASCTLLLVAPAMAQSSDEGFDKKGDDGINASRQANAEKKTGKIPGEKDKPPPPPEAVNPDYDPKEVPGKTYYFIGWRFRDVVVPKFMIDLFASGGTDVNVFMTGPEFGIRKDGLEIDLSLMYADYGFDPFLFKGKSDGDESYEMVASTMKLGYFTVDLLKDIPIDDAGKMSVLIGGGVGLAFVAGDLYRSQVYPKVNTGYDQNQPGQWNYCQGAASSPVGPNGLPWCDASNKHFNPGGGKNTGFSEPSWATGGSKPMVFPWLSIPQLSFRYKPIKQLQARADVGFSLTGFFYGLSLSYGL